MTNPSTNAQNKAQTMAAKTKQTVTNATEANSSEHGNIPRHIVLNGNESSLVIDCHSNAPKCMYWGAKLGKHSTAHMMAMLSRRGQADASPIVDPAITLTPTDGEGFVGQTGLRVHRHGESWAVFTQIINVEQEQENTVVITSSDKKCGVTLRHIITLDTASDVVQTSTQVINDGDNGLVIDWCCAATFPIETQYSDIIGFEGRWAKEFQLKRQPRFKGTYVRENRKGRTSHDAFPGVILAEAQCNELQGRAYAFHLGWSGNHKLCVEDLYDGRALVQMGELLSPGEVILESGEQYTSPTLYGVHTQQGLNGVANSFHQFVRENLLNKSLHQKSRPVHFNTWEALYFDHSTEALIKLANDAAYVGAERFVLDDGWFNHRRNDKAGLGDWYVDTSIYPEGLHPIVNHVKSLSMEFGLWFEPEMINKDSDLYRQHPDWVLHIPDATPVEFRHQFALDLARPEVNTYLFERIDALLSEYDIGYIKWDMNRDIHQAGNQYGKAAIHQQTLALYALIEKLREKHPTVEIESCSSGGARADFGILAHTDRIWTSDSNDALDRLSIQRGLSLFFPAELMGSHVGPYECHITSRKLDLSLRVATAFFGHMGMEVNLAEFTEEEKDSLKQAIELHKKYRPLIHTGKRVQFPTPDTHHSFGIVAQDKKEALFSHTEIDGYPAQLPSKFLFHGLDKSLMYRITMIWPSKINVVRCSEDFSDIKDTVFSGELLTQLGLQLPILMSESVLIFHVESVE